MSFSNGPLTRRDLLKRSAAFGAVTILPVSVFGKNDEVRLAVAGLRGRGRELLRYFSAVPNVKIAALVDPDSRFLAEDAPKYPGCTTHADVREALDRSDIDALVIATPNHWHTLMAVWALQAGKHVFVEKPISHTVYESEVILKAAERYNTVCAAGFQNRSDTGLVAFFSDLHSGLYGKVTGVRGLCYRNRSGIGRRQEPLSPPDTLNYDLWLGPAQDEPVYRNSFHYDWHWMWAFGNGDVGNQGPHEMDLLNWALQDPETLPSTIQSTGGRFLWNDAGETPNVLYTSFEHAGVPCVFEVNDIPVGNRTMNYKGIGVGVVIGTEQGEFRGGRGGGRFFDRDGKEVKHYPGDSGNTHYRNFIDAVQSNDSSILRSPTRSAASSSTLSHLANISYRLAGPASRSPQNPARHIAHLELAGVDFRLEAMHVGPELHYDSQTKRFTGSRAQEANRLLTKTYRAPYQVPARP